MSFKVTFEYDIVEAAGPLEAATAAYGMITDPAGMRPIATVVSEGGISEDIDLETEEC
jgi:hypothetical protein